MSLDLQPGRRCRAIDQRAQRGRGAKLVQRRGAQLGDQATQRIDAQLHVLDRLLEDPVDLLALLGPARAGEHGFQAGEVLQGLVVQLARPAAALALGRLQASAQALDGDVARSRPPLRHSSRTRSSAARPQR